MDLTLLSPSRTLIANSSVKKVMQGYGDSLSGCWGFPGPLWPQESLEEQNNISFFLSFLLMLMRIILKSWQRVQSRCPSCAETRGHIRTMDTSGMQETNHRHPQKMTVLFMGVVMDQGYTQGPGKADYLHTKCQRAHNPCPSCVTECL